MEVSLRSFLLDEARLRRGSAGGRAVFLAAFGKHPGWDDHIEDLGLETESLVIAKRSLYVQGIGGQVNGRWGGMTGAELRARYGHVWVWQRGDRFLIGRLWSSTDGQGRGEYPLVVCCHCVGLPLPWTVKNVLPRLAEIEEASGRMRTAPEVRALLARHRAAIVRAVEILEGSAPPANDGPGKAELLDLYLREVGEDGMLRVLYEWENKLGALPRGKERPTTLTAMDAPRHFRVPALPAHPDSSLLFWSAFARRYIGLEVPVLCLFPVGEPWAEVIVGEPSANDFLCLRASRSAIPVVSDIPYQLKSDFLDRAHRWLSEFKEATTLSEVRRRTSAEPPVSVVSASPRPVWTADSADNRGWRRGLWVSLVVLVLLAGATWVWHNAGTPRAGNDSIPAPTDSGEADSPQLGPLPNPATDPTNHPGEVHR